MTATALDQLRRALNELDRLAEPLDAEPLRGLRQRLAAHRLRLLVAGEAKRGKSTLINGLIGRDVLPSGVTPVTAVATTVVPAVDDQLLVRFLDGRCEQLPMTQLPVYVTETRNPDNRLRVRDVTVGLPARLLAAFDLELVDTPGTGSVFAHNTAAAEDALDSLDAAILVVSADPPISAAERDLLQQIARRSVRTFVVLNKADQLQPHELSEAHSFTERVVRESVGSDVPVFACSARAGGADAGFGEFVAALEQYLADTAHDDLAEALRRHVSDQAAVMLDGMRITRRTLDAASTAASGQAELFRSRVNRIAARRREIADRCAVAELRTNRTLDDAAAVAAGPMTEAAVVAARRAFDSLRSEPGTVIDERGRAVAATVIARDVTAWRDAQARRLQSALEEITGEGTAELDGQLRDLREAALELLGVELSVTAAAPVLRGDTRFRFDFDLGIGWEAPLARSAGRLLPGSRERARNRVLDDIPLLVDRQLGRARADLRERFRMSVADVSRDLTAEHDRAIERVTCALALADRIAGETADNRATQQADLTRRAGALETVLESLRSAGPIS